MQPDLPWNVAGIPSEAREAARASARREGLSVGEWLTRRILSSFAEGGENFEANAKAWQAESAIAQSTARESEDMLAHVSRSESETQNAYRRIEEHLRVLGRRLDSTERSQSENSRAMGKAATEISIASREQAQAFDQLGTHVVVLSERLKRLEQHTANDGLREAVKVLHQGLSRLADQIATTANQSTSQIAAVAGNVETVAAKLAQARIESENTAHAIEERVTAVDERVRTIEQSEGRSAALAALSDTVDRMNTRFSTSEAQAQGALARLEETTGKLDARLQDNGADRRLQSVEHALADVVMRLDHVEQRSSTGELETGLRALASRFDEAEKRQREALADLHSTIKDNVSRFEPAPHIAAAPPPMAPPPMATPMAASMAAPAFDLPPFPDQQPQFPASDPFDVPPPPPFDTGFGGDQFGASPQANESFLSAARRSAREAATAQAEARTGFNWGGTRTAAPAEDTPKRGGTRYLLIGGIVLIAVIAMIAGMMLSRGQRPRVATHSIGALFAKPATTKPVTAPPSSMKITVAPQTTTPKIETPRIEVAPTTTPKPLAEKPPVKTATLPPQDRVTTLANSGNATAQVLLGLKYLDGNGAAVNEAEAARWFERAAKQNNSIAEYRLGTLYERGRGVPADAKKAVQWYAAAAQLGNRKAMHNLAVAYAQGSGVTKDFTQAAQWFSRAANLGLSDSQFNLAVLYERGMGVPQSLLDAYKWYAVAAANGDAESKSRIDALATQLSPDDRAAAQRSADTFKPKPMDPAANTAPDISALPPA